MTESIALPALHPDKPEPSIPGYDSIPAMEEADRPVESEMIQPTSTYPTQANTILLPSLILGCAGFERIFKADPTLPLRLTRLALASGMTAFDTSPAYGSSEIILGHCLEALSSDWPRDKYQLNTKVGMYGPEREEHIYDPGTVRRSVERSLKRLGTDYLDTVYLHDIECKSSIPCAAGHHLTALDPAHAATYGLTDSQLQPAGDGDKEILAGLTELRALQSEGKIRNVGIAGYPLPILLRFAKLAISTTGSPLDIVQTYAHQTLGCHTLSQGFLGAFEDAGVRLVTNASPLALGLYTKAGPPEWHGARKTPMFDAVREAVTLCESEGVTIEDVSTEYSFRELRMGSGVRVPAVTGCSNLEELHAYLRSYSRANQTGDQTGGSKEGEVANTVVALMRERGVENWSWNT